MPDLTVTLSASQWTAYQAATTGTPSLSDVSAWLKRQLVDDYTKKLESTDDTAIVTDKATKLASRNTKITAFEA